MPPFPLLILVTASFCLIFGRDLIRKGAPPVRQINKEVVTPVEETKEGKSEVQRPKLKQKTATSSISKPSEEITPPVEQYQPKYTMLKIDSTNYGVRYSKDIYGKSLNHKPLVVLHETVGSLKSTINTFQTPHINENQQVSYHTVIALDGTIVYLVPAEKRAFGAGNSVFVNPAGESETVKTDPLLPSSVNNFAYHISLETPPDGRGNNPTHSGYSEHQYHSLAWLLAKSNIPEERITTHQAVDRSGHRFDPRSFDRSYFLKLLHFYRQ